jgi:hypothetical protein
MEAANKYEIPPPEVDPFTAASVVLMASGYKYEQMASGVEIGGTQYSLVRDLELSTVQIHDRNSASVYGWVRLDGALDDIEAGCRTWLLHRSRLGRFAVTSGPSEDITFNDLYSLQPARLNPRPRELARIGSIILESF